MCVLLPTWYPPNPSDQIPYTWEFFPHGWGYGSNSEYPWDYLCWCLGLIVPVGSIVFRISISGIGKTYKDTIRSPSVLWWETRRNRCMLNCLNAVLETFMRNLSLIAPHDCSNVISETVGSWWRVPHYYHWISTGAQVPPHSLASFSIFLVSDADNLFTMLAKPVW